VPRRADDLVPLLATARPATADGAEVQRLVAGWQGTCGLDSLGCALGGSKAHDARIAM
jgi:hypothetical protein